MSQRQYIQTAVSNWTSKRELWSKVLINYANNKSMKRSEFDTFSQIQKWLNEQAILMSPKFKEEFESMFSSSSSSSSHGTTTEVFAKKFYDSVDWSKPPVTLLYGSCVQGTAETGGDADFTILFPRLPSSSSSDDAKEEELKYSSSSSFSSSTSSSFSHFIEPPRFLQRKLVLPHFFKQAGEIFPTSISGLTTKPQQLHVDRVYHARVPILHYVAKQSILPSWENNTDDRIKQESIQQQQQQHQHQHQERDLPRFDVAACSSGCRNSYLLRYYFQQSPALRIIVLALKRWARLRAQVIQAKKGWMSPYALTLMAVYWAQQRGIVKMDLKTGPSTFDDPRWSFIESSPLFFAEKCMLPLFSSSSTYSSCCGEEKEKEKFIENDNNLPEQECIARMLLDFFVFYSEEFDRDTEVVDIRCRILDDEDNDNANNGENQHQDHHHKKLDPISQKVTTRSEWKELVSARLEQNKLEVFGLDDPAMVAVSTSTSSSSKKNNSSSDLLDLFPGAREISSSSNNNTNTNNASKEESDDIVLTSTSTTTTATHMQNFSLNEDVEKVCRHLFGHDVVSVRDPVEAHSVTRNLDFFRTEALWEEFRLAVSCEDPNFLLAL